MRTPYFGADGRTLEGDDAAGLQCSQNRYGATDNAAFVSQTVPTTMNPGQYYSVSVTMKNTGTTTWTQAGGYKLGSQNPQDNTIWGTGRVLLSGNVAPNQNVTFTFTVRAPTVPGTYNFQWRMVREFVAWFGAFTPNVPVLVGHDVRLIASYVPFEGGPRTSYTSTSANPPSFHFFYDQPAGNFEQRPGGACNTGQNNQTYLNVRVQAPAANACSFQGSWDSAPTTCTAGHLSVINSGQTVILNTDLFGTNPSTCQLTQPLKSILPYNQVGWFNVDLRIGTTWYTRRVNFIKDLIIEP
jgi:hypothetical protein